jgi:hypothetical protein
MRKLGYLSGTQEATLILRAMRKPVVTEHQQ